MPLNLNKRLFNERKRRSRRLWFLYCGFLPSISRWMLTGRGEGPARPAGRGAPREAAGEEPLEAGDLGWGAGLRGVVGLLPLCAGDPREEEGAPRLDTGDRMPGDVAAAEERRAVGAGAVGREGLGPRPAGGPPPTKHSLLCCSTNSMEIWREQLRHSRV